MRQRGWCQRHTADQGTPFEKQIELADRQRDRIITLVAPEAGEAATFKPLRIQTEARAIPMERLRAHAIAAHEEEDVAIEDIAVHGLRDERAEAIKPSAHVRGRCVRVHLHPSTMPSHRNRPNSRAAVSTSSPSTRAPSAVSWRT